MAQLKTALLVLVALGVATVPAVAQIRSEPPLVEESGHLVLDAMDHHLALPRPDWLTGDEAALGRVETSFLAEEGQALLEIYPKGEGEALWTKLYGARISRDENERTLADYRAALMMLHANSCNPALTGFFLAPHYWWSVIRVIRRIAPGSFPDLPFYRWRSGRIVHPLLLETAMIPKRWGNHLLRRWRYRRGRLSQVLPP